MSEFHSVGTRNSAHSYYTAAESRTPSARTPTDITNVSPFWQKQCRNLGPIQQARRDFTPASSQGAAQVSNEVRIVSERAATSSLPADFPSLRFHRLPDSSFTNAAHNFNGKNFLNSFSRRWDRS